MAIAHGDLLLAVSPPDVPAAEAMFERVAKLAEENGARMAQLQALTRLVALRAGTPGADDAVRAAAEGLRRVHRGLRDRAPGRRPRRARGRGMTT